MITVLTVKLDCRCSNLDTISRTVWGKWAFQSPENRETWNGKNFFENICTAYVTICGYETWTAGGIKNNKLYCHRKTLVIMWCDGVINERVLKGIKEETNFNTFLKKINELIVGRSHTEAYFIECYVYLVKPKERDQRWYIHCGSSRIWSLMENRAGKSCGATDRDTEDQKKNVCIILFVLFIW